MARLSCQNLDPEVQMKAVQDNAILRVPLTVRLKQMIASLESQNQYIGKTLILPKLNTDSISMKTVNQLPLKRENILLKEIHNLHRHVDATDQFDIEDYDITQESWITWILLFIVFCSSLVKK